QMHAVAEREGGGAGRAGTAGQGGDVVGAGQRGGVGGPDEQVRDGKRAGRRFGDGIAADQVEGVPGRRVGDRGADVDVARVEAADNERARGDVVQLALGQADLAGGVGADVDLPAHPRVLQGD